MKYQINRNSTPPMVRVTLCALDVALTGFIFGAKVTRPLTSIRSTR